MDIRPLDANLVEDYLGFERIKGRKLVVRKRLYEQ